MLKVLFTNFCIYDCAYCANCSSNDLPRAAFMPAELAALTIDFYRRNFIEGLFLSSGVFRSPDETMEQLIRTVRDLRSRGFNGYIQPGLFEECEEIANDANKAERVWQGLKRHQGSDSRSQVYQAYLTAASEVEILLRQSMEIRPDSGILPAEAAAQPTPPTQAAGSFGGPISPRSISVNAATRNSICATYRGDTGSSCRRRIKRRPTGGKW